MWSDPLLLAVFEHFPPRATILRESPGRPEEEFELETTRPFHLWFGLEPTSCSAVATYSIWGVGSAVAQCGSSAMALARSSAWRSRRTRFRLPQSSRAASVPRMWRLSSAGARRLPFAAESFDLITMYDVLEHVVSPRATLDECWRVLRPGGFSPPCSLRITTSLEGRTFTASPPAFRASTSCSRHGSSRSACEKLLQRQGVDYERYLRAEPTDKLWNQNGLTVSGCLRMIAATDFRTREVRLLGHRDPRIRDEERPADGPATNSWHGPRRCPTSEKPSAPACVRYWRKVVEPTIRARADRAPATNEAPSTTPLHELRR